MASGGGGERAADARGSERLSRFVDLAGKHLYRRNIFAVTGLPADAQGRAVRRHRQRVEARLAVEDVWAGDAGSPLAGGYRLDEVRAAFEEFQDPRRRLVDELLWRWGEADLGCGCSPSLHEDHDAAVRSHAMALEQGRGRLPGSRGPVDDLWDEAAAGWGTLLERADFREHIAHRITALDDPRLGGHPADDFVTGLARLLVSPFAELAPDPDFAPRLSRVCTRWEKFAPFSAHLPELFEETVEECTQKINDGVRSAEDKQEATLYGDAVSILRREVIPAFERLDVLGGFVPEWRREGVAHTVAVSLNNLAVALQQYHEGKAPTAEQRRTVIDLSEKAYEIAPDRDAEAIKRNWDVIHEQFSAGGRIPAGVPARRPGAGPYGGNPRRDGGICLLVFLGFVALVVQGFVVGVVEAVVTGLVVLAVIGIVSDFVERIRGMGGHR